MTESEQREAVERLKADAEKQKPIKEPETERTEQDSRRTNPEARPEDDEENDPKRPFV